jgi:hypothetical protein
MRPSHARARDALRFDLRPGAGRGLQVVAIVDVGEGGRLLGVETPDLVEPGTSDPFHLTVSMGAGLSRSAEVMAEVTLDEAGRVLSLEIPRHGPGHEISWPSGNR